MKVAIGTALFVLLAGSSLHAQEQEKDKPAQKEEKKQEPAAKEHRATHEQEKAQPQEQSKAQERQAQQHQEQQKDQTKQTERENSGAEKQQQQTAKQQQQQAAKQQQVAKQQQQQVARQEHVNTQQAQRDGGNRNARRINEQEFHQHFGREHEFRVTRSEDRRFNYGGYYWAYNDPWPSDWAYTDEVYVDEIDGEYYLIDPVHPGLRLLVVIAD
jgi:hypothetical protein